MSGKFLALSAVAALTIGLSGQASAQLMAHGPNDVPNMAGAPGMPSTTPSQPGNFPKLPPSRPCTKIDDVLGGWQLMHLYEEPRGAQTASLTKEPFQYFLFDSDSIYKKYTTNVNQQPSFVRNAMAQLNVGLQQYLVHESGVIFFYKNSVSEDTLACFIVANATPVFPAGDMLLMPTIEQAANGNTRWVRDYRRIWSVPAPPPAAAASAPSATEAPAPITAPAATQ